MLVAHSSNSNATFNNQVLVQEYYDKEWGHIIRPPKKIINKVIAYATKICNNNFIGYSQEKRMTLYEEAKKVDFNFDKINKYCYCDCSSFVATILVASGIDMNPTYITTRTMIFTLGHRDFEIMKFDKSKIQDGDILLKEGSHCVIVVDEATKKKYGKVKLKDKNSYLNIRKSPTTNSQVVGTINHNEQIEILELKNGWYKINYDGMEGYCSSQYIIVYE